VRCAADQRRQLECRRRYITRAAIANERLKRNRVGHAPTLDFVASYGDTNQTGSQLSPIGSRVKSSTVGLQLSLPLYASGGLSSRTREAAALLDKARSDFENVRRQQALAAEQNYLNVVNGIAQVRALEQALASSESALESRTSSVTKSACASTSMC
jgi:outer membrane protein